MSPTNKSRKRINPLLFALGSIMMVLLCIGVSIYAPTAQAAGVTESSSGTTASIAPSTSIKYSASSMSQALWNHGIFYVYFFEGTNSTSSSAEKDSDSDVKTRRIKVDYSNGYSWAKVHVAAMISNSASNGGKNKRLKNDSGTELSFSNFLLNSRKFYVWISDTGGNAGSISLSNTTTRTIYAGAKTFKNVKSTVVQSQPGSDHYTQGSSESDYNDIINIPFCWAGKGTHQIPCSTIKDKGVGSNDNYTCYYRMTWQQYADGISYEGFSPYKLTHGKSSATKLWTSINLGAVGITAVPTYQDAKYTKKSDIVFRNYNTTMGICLRKPSEQIKLDTNGGTLTYGGSSYTGSSAAFKTCCCETKQALPAAGYRIGRDGTRTGYTFTGYTWKSGSNRSAFSSTTPSTSKSFVAFDQASPQQLAPQGSVTVCNSWQTPAFGSNEANISGICKEPANAVVTYKALWQANNYKIHYLVDNVETEVETVAYDSSYKLKAHPDNTSEWKVTDKSGGVEPSSGYMPSHDIYARAESIDPNTVHYYLDGELIATYTVPFGTEPLVTTYSDWLVGGIEFNNDGKWDVENASFEASYKEHYNEPIQDECQHWVQSSKTVDGKVVTTWHLAHNYDLVDDYTCYYKKTYSQDFGAPVNSHGGTWSRWYTDEACTIKADAKVPMKKGDCLNFYSYTTHAVNYIVNGKTVLTSSKRYGSTEQPYAHGDDLNSFGGTFYRWFTDSAEASKASQTVSVGYGDLNLYGYTTHVIHYWMDADLDNTGADEPSNCQIEQSVRYGDAIALPSGTSASSLLTKSGCEDWATCNGMWFKDKDCTQAVSSGFCKGDTVYYSYNVVEVSYDLTSAAKDFDVAEGGKHRLFDSVELSSRVFIRSFLPKSSYQKYGSTISIAGDGKAYWEESDGVVRMARSIKGGFLDDDTSGSPLKQLTLDKSVTVFKDWAQSLYDGVITK